MKRSAHSEASLSKACGWACLKKAVAQFTDGKRVFGGKPIKLDDGAVKGKK